MCPATFNAAAMAAILRQSGRWPPVQRSGGVTSDEEAANDTARAELPGTVPCTAVSELERQRGTRASAGTPDGRAQESEEGASGRPWGQ